MTVHDHNGALDVHSQLLRSLSPMSAQDQTIRISTIISSLLESLGPNFSRNPEILRMSIPEVMAMIDGYMGKGFCEKELKSFIVSELSILRRAQTIFCSAEISDEFHEAAETMLDDIMLPQDVFVPDGLIILEKPYTYEQVALKKYDNAWQRESSDVSAILFTNTTDRADNSGVAMQLYGRWRSIEVFHTEEKPQHGDVPDYSFVYNAKEQRVDLDIKNILGNPDEIQRMHQWQKNLLELFQRSNDGAPQFLDGTFFQYGETDTKYDDVVLEWKRTLLSFFRLAYEYLEVDNKRVDRAFHKRAKRVGKEIPEDGYLTVMTLRRKMYDQSEDGGYHNSPAYAFRVRGHWKKAYMRSRKLPVGDPAAYKHIYVKDYIKGRGVVVKSKRLIKVGD